MRIAREIIKKAEWLFKKVLEGDDSNDTKFGDKFHLLSCIAEFIQNALDAAQKGVKQVLIKIRTVNVKFEVFEKAFLTDEFKKFYTSSNAYDRGVDFDGKDILCLVLEDYNTTGITGDPSVYKSKIDGENNNIHVFNNEIGGNRKVSDANKGGSEGEGKQTFCYASDISSFFYYTLREDGTDFFMGINYCGTFDFAGDTIKPLSHFGNIVKPQDQNGRNFTIPINKADEIKKLKSIFQIDRTKPGTSIIIPYINRKISFAKIKERVCNRYRVPIFRGQVSVQIQKEIIDEKNISEIYKNNYCKSENEKKMCVEFFDFVKKIDANNYIEYQIGITPGDTRNISKNSNDEKIRSDYNKGEILKFKIPVEIKKYKIVDDRKTNEVELINSFFNIYAKKFSEMSEQFKWCDTIRGNMPIVNTRVKSSTHYLTDIQEEEMRLLAKTGETANHTRIKKDHFKYRSRYKEGSQEDVIDFINYAFTTFGNYFVLDNEDLDHSTTLDLCQVIADSEIEKQKYALLNKKGDSEEDEEEDTIKVKLPPIPTKLKAYRAREINNEKFKGWEAKGIKYDKQKIDELEKVADTYIDAAEKTLKQEGLAEDTKNEIKENILKAKRRKDDYSLFKKKNYTFYPIKIRLTAAFDDGSSNPYEYYEKPDFDFNNKKQFKYNIKGDLNLSKHDENKIVLEGASENFEFSVTGFGNDCEEKVLINHQWEAM